MITIKSEREIVKMREAGRITALVLDQVGKAVAPGVTTKQLDELAEKIIFENGGVASFLGYGADTSRGIKGFPGSICASVNDELIHGIPSGRVLKEGDIISIDVGVIHNHYHGDAARTFPVGKISPQAERLIEATKKCLESALEIVKDGVKLKEIGYSIEKCANIYGYTVTKEFTGHGIGTHLHEDPNVANYGRPTDNLILKAGMTIAIEPMIMTGNPQIKIASNKWTVRSKDGKLNAHHENTILITQDGYEILTQL
ncbi:MAG: type I methionyl aminopeptidase [Bacillales bacterium]|jgi:methionyl aminopeptidase|nr:type I methionyl aminopeptidase [Bacillales bacterium]